MVPVAAWGVLTVDAAQQVLRGKPTVLPFERLLYKRAPATNADCVLQGASRLLIAAGVVIAVAPWSLAGLLGGVQAGGLAWEHAVGAIGMVCASVSVVFLVCAAVTSSQVHFVRLVPSASPDPPRLESP